MTVIKRWRKIIAISLVIAIGIGLIFWVAVFVFGWDWTGLKQFVSPAVGQYQEYFRGKTLWDWMELLIVPLVLAFGVFILNNSQDRREQIIAKQNRAQDLKIAEENRAQITLETYLDRMSDLLLKFNLHDSKPDEVVRDVARTRTLTTLRGLDDDVARKGTLLSFLHESGLINKDNIIIDLDSTRKCNRKIEEYLKR